MPPPSLSFYLGGGASRDEKPLLAAFLESLTVPRLLYIPLALDPEGEIFANAGAWVREKVLSAAPHLSFSIDTMKTPYEIPSGTFGGIYIGGGNTYRLQRYVQQTALGETLSRFREQALPCFASSAGAILSGSFIDLSGDPEIFCSDQKGLDLLGGLSVCCHFTEKDMPRIEAFLEKRKTPVLAISETTGVLVEEGVLKPLGASSAFLFTKSRTHEIKVGETLRF